MFTGIVEDTGTVAALAPVLGKSGAGTGGTRLAVATALDLTDTRVGDSIAVNGCCLTVVALGAGVASFDLGPETLSVTTLGTLAAGSRVHLERALRLSDRLGGHLVAGHVDAVGTVAGLARQGETLSVRVAAPPAITRYCIHKGSITVDGVSLTLNAVDAEGFEVGLIPHTLAVTRFAGLVVGEGVNLEADLVGKYVERLLGPRAAP